MFHIILTITNQLNFMDLQTQSDHAKMVAELAKPGLAIINTLTADKANLLHMAVGIAGEAGELLDAIKKHAIYNKPLDLENVIEELGDLEFYMQGLRAALSMQRSVTLLHNLVKLQKRYHSGTYTDQQAQTRADKSDA